jgi:hypothetical protein
MLGLRQSVVSWPGAALLLFAVGLIGCKATTMTPEQTPYASRVENCEFDVFSATPAGYAEIASIEARGPDVSDNLGEFKYRIQLFVCYAGGEAVAARLSENGKYERAAVLKRMDEAAAAAAPGSSAAPAPAAPAAVTPAAVAPAPAKPGAAVPPPGTGCQYDTQCKGERICVKSECVAPPPAAPPAAAQ